MTRIDRTHRTTAEREIEPPVPNSEKPSLPQGPVTFRGRNGETLTAIFSTFAGRHFVTVRNQRFEVHYHGRAAFGCRNFAGSNKKLGAGRVDVILTVSDLDSALLFNYRAQTGCFEGLDREPTGAYRGFFERD